MSLWHGKTCNHISALVVVQVGLYFVSMTEKAVAHLDMMLTHQSLTRVNKITLIMQMSIALQGTHKVLTHILIHQVWDASLTVHFFAQAI